MFRSYDIVILASPLYYNGPAIDVAKACSNGRKCPTNKKHKQSYRLDIHLNLKHLEYKAFIFLPCFDESLYLIVNVVY